MDANEGLADTLKRSETVEPERISIKHLPELNGVNQPTNNDIEAWKLLFSVLKPAR